MLFPSKDFALLTVAFTFLLSPVSSQDLSSCPGYIASNIVSTDSILTADLTLRGTACDVYGTDLTDLKLVVEYQTDTRLHVRVYDAAQQVYQVPSSVVNRPNSTTDSTAADSSLQFNLVSSPFSFSISRKGSKEVIFDTSAADLIFESQYLRLRTSLPTNPNLYGFGEDTDPFRLNTTNYIRTLWSRDAYEVPTGTNLYGNHPIYFEHRPSSNETHGVFLLNSNGIDLKINSTAETGQYLEYNTLGGIVDLYFLAGPSPVEVAQQYSQIIGTPVMMPYWSFGFHQCRYGMQDVYEVADVVFNYSSANIPLETMWTDIDYMDLRKVFTLDPDRFPLEKVRELVTYLHDHDQHYIMMVDPAVAYQDYPPFNNGVDVSAFMRMDNGSIFKGVVWPGITAFPDWFNPNTQDYWNNEFATFFDAETGVDIDGLWIDMNEASNFCVYPCSDPGAFVISNGDPPTPPAIRPNNPMNLPGWPADFQSVCQAPAFFQLNATTAYGQNIYMTGNVTALGNWDFSNVAPLTADAYTVARPLWELSIDLPTDTVVSYTYVFQQFNGSFTYEAGNRTITTGACGSPIITQEDAWVNAGASGVTVESVIQEVNAFAENSDITEAAPPTPTGSMLGLPGRNYINPPYKIHDAAGNISDNTLATDLMHYNGLMEYDTHNLYGTMMSSTSRGAMLNRRPGLRPIVITRSTFAGAGTKVGHWLGDNTATWYDYQISIAESIAFAGIYQLPMVGADVCGYALDTTETLCARWAMLGAFTPFYRNHQSVGFIDHEFYRWPLVAEAARIAIKARYQLLDYLYTAFYHQTIDGTPTLNPMFFLYPEDSNTLGIQAQFLFGPSILVSPVTQENATEVSIYLPDDQFYDFFTYEPIRGTGAWTTLTDVNFTSIPIYVKGGSILPVRVDGASTTSALRLLDFNLIVAPGLDGTASGSLYLDDGVSISQAATSNIQFSYNGSTLSMSGIFNYNVGDVKIADIIMLGAFSTVIPVNIPLTGPFEITLYPSGAPPCANFTGPVTLPGAINAPGDTYIRYESFPVYNTTLCAQACQAMTAYDARHATSSGTYTPCNFFVAYVQYENDTSEGMFCAFYSKPWNATYATNTGQNRGSDVYTIGSVVSYTLAVQDLGGVKK